MERRLDLELADLRKELLDMAGLAEAAIGKAVGALVARDRRRIGEVLSGEGAINALEIQVEDRCLRIFALHQPEARDLRFIAASLKISNDLERVGDMAVNIAQGAQDLLKEPLLKPLIDLPHMAGLSQAMLKDALDAFVRGDANLAREVCRRDDEVDGLEDQIFRELLTYMLADPAAISRAIHLILISRHLERVADHATNIAEEAFYLAEGRTLKHHAADLPDSGRVPPAGS
jgi:phosphate transport system protein